MRTVFMGNHTVGVVVLEKLVENTEVSAVFAHPDHPDDGTLYRSVKEFARNRQIPIYQFTGKQSDEVEKLLSEVAPDLIVVTDYKYLLKKEILECPTLGAVNFHPSLLPKYRGRAPVNWAIINGEEKCGLTVHYMDEGMDTGDVILQQEVGIQFEDTIKDLHEKLFPIYADLGEKVIELFKKGDPPRYRQDHSRATVFPRRTPEDGLINWSAKTVDIYNLIRAVTYPYPGAFSYIDGDKYMVWGSRLDHSKTNVNPHESAPGEICSISDAEVTVRTGDGYIRLTEIERESSCAAEFGLPKFAIGQRFVSEKVVR